MSDTECLFCKIVAGDIPSAKVFESDEVIAFDDIQPQAPTHVLIIPREHLATVNDLEPGNAALVGKLFLAAKAIAAERGHSEGGYRLVMNCGEGAGQSVFHLHLHLLAGRGLKWPPG